MYPDLESILRTWYIVLWSVDRQPLTNVVHRFLLKIKFILLLLCLYSQSDYFKSANFVKN